jgi:hypothetical protein
LKDGKSKRTSSRLDLNLSRLYSGDNYNGFSRSEAGFWSGFIGYMALIAGLFYLVVTYYLDQEK